jgi:GTPase SAR1 family protein
MTKEINILLLGETGVGKSTFINAFINYLKYESLEDAKSENLDVLIPSKFTITDNNYNMSTVKIGNNDPNEQIENIGMSTTQGCKSNVFHAAENKVLIRLIDTPGIGDTRGIDQDKKNFDNILNYIGKHQYLNGICILLKPNNARLNVVFRFCIQELLSHLHKNAKDNIVFCFTNARSTFYRPGDTLPPLKKQLEHLKNRSNVEIVTNRSTVYCFDNESFRFLAAIKGGITFTDADEQSFAESWKRSVDESLRLLKYLVTRTPHKVRDTLSLNNTRKIVILLAKPLAEIGQLIQINISMATEQQNQIRNNSKTIKQLEERLKISQIDYKPEPLGYPRTVCTSPDCVEVLTVKDNIKKINHKTHCHIRCYLDGVKCDLVNNPALQECTAFYGNAGICNKCGCHWTKHMHVTYENKVINVKVVDVNVENEIKEKLSFQEKKEALIKTYQTRINDLKEEQQKINDINIKFAQFLRQSAIAAFNDAYADYLDHFISDEMIKKNADPENYDDEILKGLEASKREYIEKVAIIKRAIENNEPTLSDISPEEITNLEHQLYTLPHHGQTLKNIKEQAELAQNNVFRYEEKHYIVTRPSKPLGMPLLSHAFNHLGQIKSFGKKVRGLFS